MIDDLLKIQLSIAIEQKSQSTKGKDDVDAKERARLLKLALDKIAKARALLETCYSN